MSPTLFAALSPLTAADPAAAEGLPSIGTPLLWGVSLAAVLGLLVLDFVLTRRPHEVGMREALGWSAFYVALPVAFGVYIWLGYGSERGLEFYAGYLVEKSLSVDNLFVFMLILAGFAVPRALEQRVLLYGIAGALVLRGIFIAVGAAALAAFDWVFLLFGLILVATAAKLLAGALRHDDHATDVNDMRIVRLLRRLMPVTDDYQGTRMVVRQGTRRALTPMALVVVTVLMTDIVFAVDSVPAVYGITGDPFLVFVTNAFALLGLRALYFVLRGALDKLVHLGFGLAAILGFIGAKLVLHWAHLVWPSVPEIPTLLSLGVIVGILVVTTVTSLAAVRRRDAAAVGQDV